MWKQVIHLTTNYCNSEQDKVCVNAILDFFFSLCDITDGRARIYLFVFSRLLSLPKPTLISGPETQVKHFNKLSSFVHWFVRERKNTCGVHKNQSSLCPPTSKIIDSFYPLHWKRVTQFSLFVRHKAPAFREAFQIPNCFLVVCSRQREEHHRLLFHFLSCNRFTSSDFLGENALFLEFHVLAISRIFALQ